MGKFLNFWKKLKIELKSTFCLFSNFMREPKFWQKRIIEKVDFYKSLKFGRGFFDVLVAKSILIRIFFVLVIVLSK